MKISEMIRGLSKLNFRTSILFSNKSPIEPDDLLYITASADKVKAYTVVKLRSISYRYGYKEYKLEDEFGNICAVERERIFLYRGQNLKIQRVYDIITQTISLFFLSALYGLIKLFRNYGSLY